MKNVKRKKEEILDKNGVVCDTQWDKIAYLQAAFLSQQRPKERRKGRRKKGSQREGKEVANQKSAKQKSKRAPNGSWLPPHLKPYVRSAAELRAETKHMKVSLSEEIIAQRKRK
jgi:hypothetical protein